MKRLAIIVTALALGFSACAKKSGGGGGDGGSDGSDTDTDTNTDPTTTTTTTTHNLIMFDGNNKLHSLNVATGAVTKISDNYLVSNNLLKTGNSGSKLGVALNGKFYFAANWDGKGVELWVYDPTKASDATNPSLVKDINAGATSSGIEQFSVVGNYLLFIAKTTAEGKEIWQYDTTAAVSATNPKLTYDLFSGSSNSSPKDFLVVGSKLYFVAKKAGTQYKLWRYDPASAGSATNPQRLSNLNDGANDQIVGPLASVGDKLYFAAKEDGNPDQKMYFIDTTAASPTTTEVVVNISGDAGDDSVNTMAGDGSKYVAFAAKMPGGGEELGVFDTTQAPAATTNPKMYNIRSGSDSSNIAAMTHLTGSKFAFVAQKLAANDQNLFILDASQALSATNPKEVELTNDTSYINSAEIRYIDGKIILAGQANSSAELQNFIATYDMNATSNPLSFPSKNTIADNITKLAHLSYTTTATTTTSKD